MPTLVRTAAAAADAATDNAAIVGLWKFRFVAQDNPNIPDGTLIDEGYATWHNDGTEIMNSSRPPITGNFCMGVWKQAGQAHYKLNHYGLSWDATGATFVGPANIREEVVVTRGGNRYSGTFTIDQFDTEGTLLDHVAGVITAQRITVE
jgi:hypothetical protein